MISLVYVSSATRRFEAAELRDLLEISRQNNARVDVTGMLLYADGDILQVLEGDKPAVDALFHRIEGDPRHRLVFKLYEGETEHRQFGDWSMALARPETLGATEGVESIAVLRRSLAAPSDPSTSAEVRTLLTVFARNMR
ncbi:MAG TPA: BLUF domain-containing protein [Aliidongia sp.]|uniref:BLUF domain-containing protein n=1 Tax=Aliidongia sp. TaxID=1914230 RepID=UPI002DDD8D21|nr:BLUF domain-containing protein [Aliidongia sp.]HEV2678454.1 BLUF domain-containing protein [Aliidongia sp.]